MSTTELDAALASLAQTHGVTMTALERLDDTELDYRPREGMRSPKELVFHIFGVERGLAEAVRDGGFPPLLIHPVDFMALFQQRAQQAAAAQGGEGQADGGNGDGSGEGEQKFQFEL